MVTILAGIVTILAVMVTILARIVTILAIMVTILAVQHLPEVISTGSYHSTVLNLRFILYPMPLLTVNQTGAQLLWICGS